ncbi:MAG TPA: hypothetical protein VGR81_03560 [Candidatus Acidoferrales bacterium]|nr:hypothetical protein [Candidatus Acidoferrales bacterium]
MVIELTEAEASSYVMSRQWVAQPGTPLNELAGRSRVRSFVYFDQTVLESLRIISYLRRSTYRLLYNLPENCWDYTAAHPRNDSLTLHQWLMILERTIPRSVEQMHMNYDSWIKTHPAKKLRVKSVASLECIPETIG